MRIFMVLKSVLNVSGKALTQVAKKAYVKPMCEVSTLESIGLKMEQLSADVVNISRNFRKPSEERLAKILSENGLSKINLKTPSGKNALENYFEKPYISDNNAIFVERLAELFPMKNGEKVNFELQKRILYLENINHSQHLDKEKFLTQFLDEVNSVENMMTREGKVLYEDCYIEGLYSKKAILQAMYNNPERYQEIKDLLNLYKQGKVPRHCVENFFPEAHFHALPKGDMARLLSGEHYFPELAELSESAISKIDTVAFHVEAHESLIGELGHLRSAICLREKSIQRWNYIREFLRTVKA